MKPRVLFHRLSLFVFALALALTGWQPASAQSAQPFSTSGWFSIIWGDGPSGSQTTATAYTLTDDSGQTSLLSMEESLAAPLGGVLALDRQRITVSGVSMMTATSAAGGPATIQVSSLTLDAQPESADLSGQLVSGSQPFISIMCKFQDVATTPKTLTYFQNMYSNVHPGLDHYWRELSYLTANIAGSTAFGWVTLPHPRSYYLPGGKLDFDAAATDCTHAADAAINFAPFKGINLMFNADLDGYAWGGAHCLTLDGVSKCWPMTWEPPWGYSAITVISHEMGHAFGLPHSSGAYGQTYDNQWDVMSDGWANCSRSTHATYGCLGQQTIAYHKDKLGWIPAAKKYYASGDATITLERLAVPTAGNYLMAQISIPGSSTHFYTVETRRQVGYDVKLPGQGVIIHDIDLTRERPANVIDPDGNGNTGDAGAIWSVGETFSDGPNGISIQVLSATATGFQVAIHAPVIPKTTAVFRSLAAKDGWTLESGENTGIGGSMNATATTLRLGDNAANKQYRSILHFSTGDLPDNAVITKVTLKILMQGLTGTSPFTTHGALFGDIRKPYFGAGDGLQGDDFQNKASKASALVFSAVPTSNWYSGTLKNGYLSLINPTGVTQFRLHFNLDDNNDAGADYMAFYSGNVSNTAFRPQLVVEYFTP